MKPPTLGTKSCKYAMVKSDESMSGFVNIVDRNGIFLKLTNQLSEPFEMVNCSAILTTGAVIGERLTNGTYTGVIGEMVKGEINGTGIGYILGSDEYKPVHEGPVCFSAELKIVSLKQADRNSSLGLGSWTNNFDLCTYLYIAISFILFSLSYIFFLLIERFYQKSISDQSRRTWRFKRLIIRSVPLFFKTIWYSFLSMIGIHNIEAPTRSTKILVILFSLAIFNLVFGYFLNLVSVDMVAVQPVPSIDTLADLLDNHHFRKLKVTTLGGLWHEHALRGAIPGSPENQLWNRINGNLIPITLDKSGVNKVAEYGESFSKYEVVVSIDSLTMPTLISGICQLKPDIDPKLYHLSKDWFGERLLVPTVSRSSDPALLSWINYKYRQQFQSDLIAQIVREAPYTPHLRDGITYHTIERCIGSSVKEDMEVPEPFGFKYYSPLIILCAFIFVIASAIFLFEILVSNFLTF